MIINDNRAKLIILKETTFQGEPTTVEKNYNDSN